MSAPIRTLSDLSADMTRRGFIDALPEAWTLARCAAWHRARAKDWRDVPPTPDDPYAEVWVAMHEGAATGYAYAEALGGRR